MLKTKLHEIEKIALSDSDIKKIIPNIKIINYPELANKTTFPTDKNGRLIIFFETESQTVGHWLAIKVDTVFHTVSFFDSYGLPPDGDRAWLSPELQNELNENKNLITPILKIYAKNGYKIYYNHYDFQSKVPDISTCGRYASLFLLVNQPIKQFQEIFKAFTEKFNLTNDEMISYFINKYSKLN